MHTRSAANDATRAARPAAARPGKPSAASLSFLMVWHGVLAGGFLVSMFTGSGAYGAHTFAGVVTIFAIGLRLLVGVAFPKTHVLSFPLPSLASLGQGANGVRRFISHSLGVTMLVACALATLTGWYAWHAGAAHSYVSYLALSIIGGHVAVVMLMQGWKKAEAFVRARS